MAEIFPFRGKFPGIEREDRFEGLYVLSAGEERYGLFSLVRLEELSAGIILFRDGPDISGFPEELFWLEYEDPRGVTGARLKNLCSSCPQVCEGGAGGAVLRVFAVNDPVSIAAIEDDFIDRRLYLRCAQSGYLSLLKAERERYRPGNFTAFPALLTCGDLGPQEILPGSEIFPRA